MGSGLMPYLLGCPPPPACGAGGHRVTPGLPDPGAGPPAARWRPGAATSRPSCRTRWPAPRWGQAPQPTRGRRRGVATATRGHSSHEWPRVALVTTRDHGSPEERWVGGPDIGVLDGPFGMRGRSRDPGNKKGLVPALYTRKTEGFVLHGFADFLNCL